MRAVCADLDVVPLVVVATIPEQPVVDDTMNVQLVQQRIAILRELISS